MKAGERRVWSSARSGKSVSSAIRGEMCSWATPVLSHWITVALETQAVAKAGTIFDFSRMDLRL